MTKEKSETYVSPQARIVEIKDSQILCASPEGFGEGPLGPDPGDWT